MRNRCESISASCIMSVMFTVSLIVLSSRWRGDDYTHTVNVSGTLSTSAGFRRPCPDSRKISRLCFGYRA